MDCSGSATFSAAHGVEGERTGCSEDGITSGLKEQCVE